ncbi:hypothetical protein [Stigmatella erecta]|uniref:Uncharacterized protein n=1 Tax=Stigmatella erecta TaxID=83460 RepID=A0A1I0L7I2_9BACT|nr:hypothetical protein [Stigmatella erecta]SEU35851.1 hypothetical protein SAMN05443639_12149 [Stigmatella erecta]
MNIPTAISQGKPTLLGFSTPRRFNPVSWLVRRFTGSECSHCFFLYWDDDFKCDMVLESHELGFRLITWPRFVANNRIVALIEPTHVLEQGFLKLGAWVGSAYDFQGLFGQSLVQLGRWLKRKWRNPSQSSQAMFCSESIVRCMQWAEHPEAATFSPKETTPQDLLAFYRESPRGKALDIQLWA